MHQHSDCLWPLWALLVAFYIFQNQFTHLPVRWCKWNKSCYYCNRNSPPKRKICWKYLKGFQKSRRVMKKNYANWSLISYSTLYGTKSDASVPAIWSSMIYSSEGFICWESLIYVLFGPTVIVQKKEINWNCTCSQTIQDVDKFVSLSDFEKFSNYITCSPMQTHCSEWVPSEWEFQVKQQIIIHK